MLPLPAHRGGSRQGAALVLVLVVLSALLILGLPFVLTNAAALTGTQAFAAQEKATSHRDSSQALTLGLAAQAMLASAKGDRLNTNLQEDLNALVSNAPLAVLLDPDQPQRMLLQVGAGTLEFNHDPISPQHQNHPSRPTYLGGLLEDEGGKLNPNHLTASAWHLLLQQVGIRDWDDGSGCTAPGADPTPYDSESAYRRGTDPDPNADNDGGGTPFTDDQDDRDRIGELAEALAQRRFAMPDQRFSKLDQLIGTSPGHNQVVYATCGWEYGRSETNERVGPKAQFGLRWPLTQAEYRLLRCFLTLHHPAQARNGYIDLGTIMCQAADGYPAAILDGDPTGLLQDTVVTSFDPNSEELIKECSRVSSIPRWDTNLVMTIEAPAAINIHTAPKVVREVLQLANRSIPGEPITQHLLLKDDFLRLGAQTKVTIEGVDALTELPPIDLRSWGVATFECGATAFDPLLRPLASARRQAIGQAMPGTTEITLTWDAQSEFENLRLKRMCSQTLSWPRPYPRLIFESGRIEPASDSGSLRLGLQPTMALRVGVPGFPFEWTALYQADPDPTVLRDQANDFMKVNRAIDPATPTAGFLDKLKPDGLYLSQTDELAYGFISNAPAGPAPFRPVDANNKRFEMQGRNLSVWIKPAADWKASISGGGGGSSAAKFHPILELRTPIANCLPQGFADASTMPPAPVAVTNEYQNLWSLGFDADHEHLVLVLANAAIEHTVASGVQAPPDDPTTVYWNELSLGTATFGSSGSGTTPRVPDLAPARPINRVEYRYKIKGGLVKDRWYHVQVAMGSDRPGQVALIVDGLVGREVARLPANTAMRTGDHGVVPALVLDEDLPFFMKNDLDTTGAAGKLDLPVIKVRATSLTKELFPDQPVQQVLPARGLVLIGNEYIRYEAVEGDTLKNCYRGQRANTNVDEVLNQRWPNTEGHLKDDLVVPGGYRYRTGGKLFRGETMTTHCLLNGDCRPATRAISEDEGRPDECRWRCWGKIDPNASLWDGTDVEIDPVSQEKRIRLDANTRTLHIKLSFPAPKVSGNAIGRLPAEGVVVIQAPGQPEMYYYYNDPQDHDLLANVRLIQKLDDKHSSAPMIRFKADMPNKVNWPTFWVISLGVTKGPSCEFDDSTGHLKPGQFPDRTQVGQTQVLQIADRWLSNGKVEGTGRIEWVSYDTTWNGYSATGFFIDYQGFAAISRGIGRTVYAPLFPVDGGDTNASQIFGQHCQILPVQTNFGSSHWLATGDVVTIMPNDMSLAKDGTAGYKDLSKVPIQVLVRFAATDAYLPDVKVVNAGIDLDPTRRNWKDCKAPDHPLRPPGGSRSWDTRNEFFTFDRGLPVAWSGNDIEILCGPCWGGRDLSSTNPVTQPLGMMPRLDTASGDCQWQQLANDDPQSARLWVFRTDPREGWKPPPPKNGPAPIYQSEAAIDGLAFGALPGATAGSTSHGRIVAFNDGWQQEMVIGSSEQNFTIETDVEVFPANYSLVLIDGEVCAVKKDKNRKATVIGRGLLGSVAQNHRTRLTLPYDLPTPPHPPRTALVIGPTILALPFGPVRQLIHGVPADLTGLIDQDGQAVDNLIPPTLLLAKYDGSQYEVLAMRNSFRRWTDPQGLRQPRNVAAYYTAPWLRGLYHTTPTSFGDNDLLIGWWPRHQPCYPAQRPAGLSENQASAMLRSRTYAWTGFAVNARGTIFAKDAASMDEEDTGKAAWFMPQALALDTGFQWNLAETANPSGTVSKAFDWNRFQNSSAPRPTDGAELRLFWRYVKPQIASNAPDFFEQLAQNSNQSPGVSRVSFRFKVPTMILSTLESQ